MKILCLTACLLTPAFASMAGEAPETAVPREITVARDGSELVYIPAGEFWMGGLDSDRSPEGDEIGADEKPRHRVFLDAFYMGKYEVTVSQYARFCKETGRVMRDQASPAGPDHLDTERSGPEGNRFPVRFVSWFDAAAYCEWAGLRLPTEAEWEKAARGGTETRFWWGFPASHDRAHYDAEGPAPVGSYPPNSYGLYDTAGNVWEWVADWYSDSYYSMSPDRNPPGPATGTTRVHRGGSWSNYPYYLRSSIRYDSAPDRWSKLMGFRCAKSP